MVTFPYDFISFLMIIYGLTYFFGKLLEKIRIPWVFSALIFGMIFSLNNPFKQFTSANEFSFMSDMGMYLLLFIIGFGIDFKRMKQQSVFILKTTFAVIIAESFFGSLIIHFVFGLNWFISVLVGLSFATVGEALLVPILDEFKLIKTGLGQTIIGVAVMDDIFEVLTIIIAVSYISYTSSSTSVSIPLILLVLTGLFVFSFLLTKLKKKISSLKFHGVASFFAFIIFFIFFFVALGNIADAGALGALLAGIALKNFLPKERINSVNSEIRNLAYGLFVPIFLFSIGLETNVNYLIAFPLLVVLVMGMVKATKITTSYIVTKNVIGKKQSIILGIALSVKFSTSIVIIKMLYDSGIITNALFSVLIGAKILFKFIVPALLSYLITKWGITGKKYASIALN